jgi:hypothetical protein
VATELGTYDGPTNTEMAAAFTEIKGATWAPGTDTLEEIRDRGDAAWVTGETAPTVGEVRIEMDTNSTQLAAIVADTNELQTDDVPGLIAALPSVGDFLTTVMTESYAADGAAPSVAQALFAIQQFLQEKSISGVTMSVNNLAGSTAMTFTLDSGTAPTAITRAT